MNKKSLIVITAVLLAMVSTSSLAHEQWRYKKHDHDSHSDYKKHHKTWHYAMPVIASKSKHYHPVYWKKPTHSHYRYQPAYVVTPVKQYMRHYYQPQRVLNHYVNQHTKPYGLRLYFNY